MKLQLITFIVSALFLSSCGTTKNTDTMDTPNTTFSQIPTETFWKLETLEGKDFSSFNNNGREIGFTLNKKGDRISGYSGCNNFFGTYKFEAGNRIHFSSLGSTKMACPDSAFNENEFLNIFELADNYTINGNTLSLNVGRRAPLAVFKKVEKSSEGITNKHWKLKTLEGREVKMGRNQEREVYFTLQSEDNRMNGFAGCNIISGNYKLEKDNKIQFSEIISTMMVCPDVDFNESEFVKILSQADGYSIKGDELSLNVGKKNAVAVFKAIYFN